MKRHSAINTEISEKPLQKHNYKILEKPLPNMTTKEGLGCHNGKK